jgi:hypothetical protein
MTVNVPAQNETSFPRIVRAIRELAAGRSNASSTFYLASDGTSASTTVQASNCGEGTIVLLVPMNAAAAKEWAAGSIYVSAVNPGSFTVAHTANNASRKFGYGLQG